MVDIWVLNNKSSIFVPFIFFNTPIRMVWAGWVEWNKLFCFPRQSNGTLELTKGNPSGHDHHNNQ